ncbi:helix-turn-helix domain-containing protein [Streptacidiphilus griseoplanus]|uniref:helix-turn-helix domain-containing protein n=1 Tax=Peterkaempfera griseoplana TaxID=66896 RepID=UPI0006E33937|nr:helix-turn-helix domain-containing protein [Peterkaempfera griseoplana]
MTRLQRDLPISRHVATQIRHHREHRNLSQSALAQALTEAGYPLDRVGVAETESGDRKTVSVDLLVAAAQVFGLPLAALLDAAMRCQICDGHPPAGFTCNACHRGGPTRKDPVR